MKIAINPEDGRIDTTEEAISALRELHDVSKADNIRKLWLFNDDDKYLGLIKVEEIGGRILMKITMHGTVDFDLDAYGLDVEIIKGMTEKHKTVKFRKSD